MTTHLILILSNTKKNLSHWGQAVERNVRASWEAFFFCGHERMSHRQMKKEMKRPLLWGTQWRPGNDVPEVWFLLETFDTPKSYPKIAKIIIIFSGSWRFFLLGPAHISPGILMPPPHLWLGHLHACSSLIDWKTSGALHWGSWEAAPREAGSS